MVSLLEFSTIYLRGYFEMNDHLMSLTDLARLLTDAAGKLSVASGWVQEEGFPAHYRERAAELEEIAARLSTLLADLDKLTESDPDLLGTTSDIREKIFRQSEEGYSVIGPAQSD